MGIFCSIDLSRGLGGAVVYKVSRSDRVLLALLQPLNTQCFTEMSSASSLPNQKHRLSNCRKSFPSLRSFKENRPLNKKEIQPNFLLLCSKILQITSIKLTYDYTH